MAIPGAVTDPDQLLSSDIHYDSQGTQIKAYLAMPRTPGPHPGLIVIHEAMGLNDHIKDLTRRFAQRGYIALAPQLYSRIGEPAEGGQVMEKMFSLRDADAVKDLEAAAARIRQEAGSNGRVGCIGFCSGGRHTLLFATSSTAVDAAVDCWGGFIRRASPDAETTPARPTPVMDLAPNLHCPLFIVIGEEDKNPSPEDGEELARRLRQAGKPFEFKVYEDAGHAFLADYRPSYREAAAFRLWEDANAFLDQHLR